MNDTVVAPSAKITPQPKHRDSHQNRTYCEAERTIDEGLGSNVAAPVRSKTQHQVDYVRIVAVRGKVETNRLSEAQHVVVFTQNDALHEA